jgi:predicted metal-dependent phosphoesterase TrpH
MGVDLHVHSVASDGLHTPRELLSMAAGTGLSAISITDHDNVGSIAEASSLAPAHALELVPGLEMSSHIREKDAHFLAYYLDYESPRLHERLSWLREARLERTRTMLALLRSQGVELSLEELGPITEGGAIGRPHVAELLVRRGYVRTVGEAFERFLQRGACCYVEKEVLPPSEILDLILDLGGVPVLAHPGVSRIDEHIEELASAGLQGLEAFHADHTAEQIGLYRRLASELGLIVTGGSDFHGEGVRGTRVGANDVPDWVLERLKDRRDALAGQPRG